MDILYIFLWAVIVIVISTVQESAFFFYVFPAASSSFLAECADEEREYFFPSERTWLTVNLHPCPICSGERALIRFESAQEEREGGGGLLSWCNKLCPPFVPFLLPFPLCPPSASPAPSSALNWRITHWGRWPLASKSFSLLSSFLSSSLRFSSLLSFPSLCASITQESFQK